MKKIFKSVLFWVIVIEIVLGVILFIKGFRITYSPSIEYDWDAIGAIGQWAGVIIALLIPIAVLYIRNRLDKNKEEIQNNIDQSKEEIGEANSDLYNELSKDYEKIKALIKLVDEEGKIVINGGNWSDNENEYKEKALKFINISMQTNTKRVAEHLGIDDDEAFDILVEMVRHDETISCGGQLNKNNLANIVWIKKRKR